MSSRRGPPDGSSTSASSKQTQLSRLEGSRASKQASKPALLTTILLCCFVFIRVFVGACLGPCVVSTHLCFSTCLPEMLTCLPDRHWTLTSRCHLVLRAWSSPETVIASNVRGGEGCFVVSGVEIVYLPRQTGQGARLALGLSRCFVVSLGHYLKA